MASPVIYFEVLGPGDPETFSSFYTSLFGWQSNTTDVHIPYRLIDTRSAQGVNGGIGIHPHGDKYVTFYAQIDDLQAILDKAGSLGGRTKMPVTEVIPGELSVALVESPSGNVVGISSGRGSAPQRQDSGGKHPVVHFEIAAPDAATEQRFWGELFGWRMQTDPQFNYAMVDAEAGGIAGGIGPHPGGGKHVTFYVQAANLQEVLDRAEQMGGKTVMAVMEVPGGPTIAQLADPVGNMIGLVEG